MDQRGGYIDEKIGHFNNLYNKQLKIVYSPKEKSHSYYLVVLTSHFNSGDYLPKLKLSWGDVERFISIVVRKDGIIKVFRINNE